MKLAILMPLRVGGSGGLLKHIAQLAPRWLLRKDIERISIVAPEGLMNGLADLGVDLQLVPRDDYRTGFREMGRLVEAGGYDAALCTTARSVKFHGTPIVTMVRNIEPIQKPSYKEPIIWRMRRLAIRRENAIACRQATRILAVSNYVKEQVCRRFGVHPDVVDVVYHGFDPDELDASRKPNLHIPQGGFLFSAGSFVPYRGYEDIVRALSSLRSKGGKAPCAILAGSEVGYGTSYEQSLKKLAKSLNVEDRIVWGGQLQHEEMTWCFQNCRMFIQTSRAESFSNIQVEAMGHGCVCVSCDHPPMPEIFQNAAIYYSVGDADALAAKIEWALKMSQEESNTWHSRARRRVSFFSWDKTADQTLEVLERAIKCYRK
jgi:glycosyltransferase involved in cell wall biosynthesis